MLATLGDTIVNLDQVRQIEEIEPGKGARPRIKLTWADGSTTLLFDDYSRAERLCGRFIEAKSGYKVIQAFIEDGKAYPHDQLIPVIGFRIEGPSEYEVHPITLEGERSDDANVIQGLVLPNGQVFDADGIAQSIDEWKVRICREKQTTDDG
jgi:hypothetical protein